MAPKAPGRISSRTRRRRSRSTGSKLEGELEVALAAPLSHSIVRSAWLFVTMALLPATMLRLAAQRDTLSVVDDQRGCPTFTPDLAQALLAVARSNWLGRARRAA